MATYHRVLSMCPIDQVDPLLFLGIVSASRAFNFARRTSAFPSSSRIRRSLTSSATMRHVARRD
jgi:hypothetical protein